MRLLLRFITTAASFFLCNPSFLTAESIFPIFCSVWLHMLCVKIHKIMYVCNQVLFCLRFLINFPAIFYLSELFSDKNS